MKITLEWTYILTFFILILAAVASAGGLFIPGLYRDSDIIKRAWLGSDVTTLFLVIPLLVVALRASMRGSLRAKLVWVGLLGYMLYNFAFYLIDSFLLIHYPRKFVRRMVFA
jgi:thiamine transporter ThiT